MLFLFCTISINAMESRFNDLKEIFSDPDKINKLCWHLNGINFDEYFKYHHTLHLPPEIPTAMISMRNIVGLKLLQAYKWNIDDTFPFHRSHILLENHCRCGNFTEVVLLAYLHANINAKLFPSENNCALFKASIYYTLSRSERSLIKPEKIRITQFLLSQNAEYKEEHLYAQIEECKILLQSKKRPPIPKEARMLMLDWTREKKNIACILRKRELGIK